MSHRQDFPIKVALGYALLLVCLGASVLMIYRYTRSAIQITDVERAVSERRQAVNHLVHCILEAESLERAVCMGSYEALVPYERASDSVQVAAVRLSSMLADERQQQRIDTLLMLLASKRNNTGRLLDVLTAGRSAALYERRAEQLRSGRDSVMVRGAGRASSDKKEQVTYVVEKTRPTFLGRLADAFRRQKSDTTVMQVDSVTTTASGASAAINVSDTVASLLTDVGRREEQLQRSRSSRIRESAATLQASGMEMARRSAQLIDDIGRAEQQWMQRMGDDDASRRRTTVARIGMTAAAAVVAAVILLSLVWRDNRRAERYRRSLDAARRRAEHLLEQRERLLLTITHDIKSPVSSISGFTELLMPHVAGERPRAFLDNIRSSALHLLRLVGALLDYHQLEQGRIAVSEVSFSPRQLLSDCTVSFRPRATAKGLSLMLNISDTIPSVCRGDAFRIRQIAENLIGNAIKYTDSGSVTVTAAIADGHLVLSVADTGRGMTADESARIFRAFTRLPGAQGIEGVGLGLSITRELVTLLGGTITLDTAPGRGSTFTVSLPVGDAVADELLPPSDTVEATPPSVPAGSLNILAVDDDPLQLQLLAEMLRRLSAGRWAVTACNHINDMLSHIASGGFDLLLTDIEMPAMNGFEIASRLRDSGLPVVAMTAHDTISADDFARAGFAASLRKPFTAAALADVVRCVVSSDALGSHEDDGRDMPPEQSRQHAADMPETVRDECPQPILTPSFAFLTAFADGDDAAACGILSDFCTQTTADIAALRRAAAASDVALAGSTAHRLIPLLTMTYTPPVAVLRRLADARHAGVVSGDFSAWCHDAAAELERVVGAASQEVMRLSAVPLADSQDGR